LMSLRVFDGASPKEPLKNEKPIERSKFNERTLHRP
jgi:hypothetical protein